MAKMRERKVMSEGKTYTYYEVDFGINEEGKRERRTFKTKALALECIKKFKSEQARYGTLANQLSSAEYALATAAYDALESAEIPREKLLDIVNGYIAREAKVKHRITLVEAEKRYLSKFDIYTQQRYIHLIEFAIRHLAESLGDMTIIADVTEEDIEQHFERLDGDKDYSPKTFNSMVLNIRTFFSWCVEQAYIAENPTMKIKNKRIAYADPVFIMPSTLATILDRLERDETLDEDVRKTAITVYALSFFCGIRTSEICRLTPDAINPNDKIPFVRISTTKGAAKGIKGRTIDIEANAAAWLKKYPLTEKIAEREWFSIRDKCLKGPLKEYAKDLSQNIGRHSFITYHTAKYRDYSRTEAFVGTSSSMRCRHYQGLATSAQAEAYFEIFPCEDL